MRTLGAVKRIGLGLSVLLAASIVSSVGCGSVKDNPGDDFTLTATPASVNVPIAGTGTVTIAVDRTGSGEDVMLSAQNLPAWITATFATNPVPAGANESDVTFAVAPGTPPGTSNVTVVGTNGGVEKTVTVGVVAQTITVTGTVRGGARGVTVRLVGKPAVTSGVGGTFTFTDVSPPYDLYTVGSTNTTPSVIYYQGLTRTDPVVTANEPFIPGPTINSSGTIAGTKSGTTDMTNPMMVAWDSGGAETIAPSAYSFPASWPQAATRQGTLYGFQFSRRPTTGAPDVFTSYGSSGQTTVMENTTNTVNLIMAAPATAALTGAITAPSGFPSPTITLTQQLGTVGTLVLWTGTTTTADATIPLVGAGKAALFAIATLDNATTQFVHPALAAATDVTFALPAPSVQTAPVNAATGVTATTPFTWSAAPNTVYQLDVVTTATTGSGKAFYILLTASPTATIPAVPELTLPPNQSFVWNVSGFGPNTSADDAASATGLEFVTPAEFDSNRHWLTTSTERTFTTAP